MSKGKMFIISGPSGVGKGTICSRLLEKIDVELSISMTTREAREGEVEGVSYYFVSHEQFRKMIEEDGFLEYASVYENYYGTPKAKVLEKLDEGRDVILEIEMQGAAQAKKAYPEAVSIFILPPSLAELKRRLIARGTESAAKVALRQSKTLEEIGCIRDYDYYIINDIIDETVDKIIHVIESEHAKVSHDADEIVRRYKEEFES